MIRSRAARTLPVSLSLCLWLSCLTTATASDGPFDAMSPGLTAVPTLKADTAVYNVEQGVLQYAFTFVNPSDAALYLDCQVPPRATLSGGTLVLVFDRRALPESGALAGGPAAREGDTDSTLNPDDFPPQRIGGTQTFQGQRRLDRVLGDYRARPKFSSLELRMAFYPQRDSGEGEPFLTERRMQAASRKIPVARKGKAPPPPKVLKYRVPAGS